jgi:hypothetical protein
LSFLEVQGPPSSFLLLLDIHVIILALC